MGLPMAPENAANTLGSTPSVTKPGGSLGATQHYGLARRIYAQLDLERTRWTPTGG